MERKAQRFTSDTVCDGKAAFFFFTVIYILSLAVGPNCRPHLVSSKTIQLGDSSGDRAAREPSPGSVTDLPTYCSSGAASRDVSVDSSPRSRAGLLLPSDPLSAGEGAGVDGAGPRTPRARARGRGSGR